MSSETAATRPETAATRSETAATGPETAATGPETDATRPWMVETRPETSASGLETAAGRAVEATPLAPEGTGRYAPPRSRWVDLGVPVHYVYHAGPADGPLLVMVHGLGGSLVNWSAVAPLLTGTCRILALDLIGFGYTQAGTHSTSITANQQMLHRFLSEVAGGPVVLVGNSMGGLITILEASQHPESVTAVVLIDPALPVTVGSQPDALVSASFGMYAVPHLGRAMLRARRRVRTPEQLAMDILRLCCADPTRVPAEVREQLLEVARERSTYPDIDEHFLGAARSLVRMLVRRSTYEAAMAAIRVPVLLLHGEKDRLVMVGASRAAAAANPSWHLEVAPDVGHVPMLEVPEWTAGRILGWLATDVSGQRRTGGVNSPGTGTPDADAQGTGPHGTETLDTDTYGTETPDTDGDEGAARGTADRT